MGNVKVPKFEIQQIAFKTQQTALAMEILKDLGLTDWIGDTVTANGYTFNTSGQNKANLYFNYQAGTGSDAAAAKPLELEILEYTEGVNWLQYRPDSCVSHIGMHVTNDQLSMYRAYFASKGIRVAQEVMTQSHTNEAIKDKRRYNYVIFDTHEVLGVDLKFIVRLNIDYSPYVNQ